MGGLWLISYVTLWVLVSLLGFLLIGSLRALAMLTWRLDQLEATAPRHIGRGGLDPGSHAPDFTLERTDGGELSLAELNSEVLLVFMQARCSPCQAVVPQLNRIHERGTARVLAVCHGEPAEVQDWAAAAGARFPVLVQTDWTISRRYEVFATPFAFFIDRNGTVQAKGIISDERYIKFLLNAARKRMKAARPQERAAELHPNADFLKQGVTP